MKYLYLAYVIEKLRPKASLATSRQGLKFIPFKLNLKYNTKKILVVLMIFISIIGLFYWFEIRPSKIRQKCSFVTKHIEAISARPAKTESELLSEGMIKPCSVYEQIYYGQFTETRDQFTEKRDKYFCESRNKDIIESYSQPILAEEAKDILEPASEEKYDFCVRSKGLKY